MSAASAKSKKKYVKPATGDAAAKAMSWTVGAYVFLMLAVYPLYYQDKYYNMGDAKWIFFKWVSGVFAVVALGVFIWYLSCFISKHEFKKLLTKTKSGMIITDWFVLSYMVATIISAIFTPYKENVIWGYDGWYMGLVAQLGFCLIYFLVSRFWRWDDLNMFIYMCSSGLVFFFGVIMKFRIDPMEMYVDLEEQYVENFLSTLGQATWYSSFLCLIYPIVVIAFWFYDKLWQRIVFGMFTVLCFMTVVTQNSDSAYMAIAGVFFMLLWISLDSNKHFIRFLEVMLLATGSFKVIGLLQIKYADVMVRLDKLSIFMSQSKVTTISFFVFLILYIIMQVAVRKTKVNISVIKPIRYVLLGVVLICIAGGVIYIYRNTNGLVSEKYASGNNYLKFDNYWGNSRGLSWKAAVGTFKQENLWLKLFGAGPDGFAQSVYVYFSEPLNERWGENTTLTCAHNEWLNILINGGIVGFITYLGIFISSIATSMKNSKKRPIIYGMAISVLAYILHNFFCYQQIICTPIVFIIMGMAVSIDRFGMGEEE
ncbi:MAG: O-antigen ligase family protein [Lachnospiraceae bacterium]|nr:O-antigen ligase family protein [Lachnospiraceae bacterium]